MIRVLEVLFRRTPRRDERLVAHVVDLELRAEQVIRARQDGILDDYAATDQVVGRRRAR